MDAERLPKPDWQSPDGAIVLYRGDCLEILPHLPQGCVDAVVTDPPYGIDYQSAWRTDRAAWKPKIANDTKPFVWFLPQAFRVCSEGSPLLCFCRWDVQECFQQSIQWSGFTLKSQVIWDRESHGMGDLNGTPAPQHDVIWFATSGRFKFHGERQKSVVRSQRLGGEQLTHPNEKPVELLESLVVGYVPSGGVVLDCFFGSCSTGCACVRTGRRFIGIELDESYFDIAVKRIQAELAQSRLPFPEPEPAPIQGSLFTDEA